MTRRILLVAVLLTAGCAGHRPLVILTPAVPPVVERHDWIVPLSTPNQDRICVQTVDQSYRPCWTVGQLRLALVSLKAE
jgi:hypothetical protein